MTLCGVFWGSHGCSEEPGHDGQHLCNCCDIDDPEHVRLHGEASAEDYGADGCAATWPYYGRESMSGPDATLPFYLMSGQHLTNEFERLEGERG